MLEKNLSALKVHYFDLYNHIVDFKMTKYKLVNSKNGMANLLLDNNTYLHSRYNPQNESHAWVNGFKIQDEDTIFIIGLGLGYYLKIVAERYANKKIIIVEPDLEIFIHNLKINDFSKYIENENIVFLVNMDPHSVEHLIGHYLYTNKINKIYFSELPSYKKLKKEYIEEIYNHISKMTLSVKGNLITEIAFGQMWLDNTITNLKSILEYSNINNLKGICKDIPVIIVSAGPSLEKSIPYLRTISNKALIMSVGSSANILEHNGIIPHIILAVDGNITEAHIFEKLTTTKPILIYSTSVHHNVVSSYKGPKLWMKLNVDNYMEFVLNELNIDTVSLSTGPSVANIALDFSNRWLESKNILFIGQDLAYSNGKLYADGNVHSDIKHSKFEENHYYKKTTDIYGNDVYTSDNFIMMKHWFEEYLSVFKKKEGVYNCTEGGLNIKGIPNIPFQEAINRFCTDEVGIYNKILKVAKQKPVINKQKYDDFIKKCQNQSEKCIELSKKRLELSEEAIKNYNDEKAFDEKLNEILLIGNELEEIKIYKYFIMLTGERYINAITSTTHNELQRIKERKEQKKAVMKGLIQQYIYIHQCLEVAKRAFDKYEK